MSGFEKELPSSTKNITIPTADVLNAPVSQAFKPVSHNPAESIVVDSPLNNKENRADSPIVKDITGSLDTAKNLPFKQNTTSTSHKNFKDNGINDKENTPLRAASNIPKVGLDTLVENNPLNNLKNEVRQ